MTIAFNETYGRLPSARLKKRLQPQSHDLIAVEPPFLFFRTTCLLRSMSRRYISGTPRPYQED